MQLVRCEQCGAKALIAASQCPRCAHAFFLRDSRGKTVPLGHCKECDTFYPRSRGGCRWCGTKVSPLPIGVPALLLGVLVAACVVGVGVWQYRARAGPTPQRQGEAVQSKAPVPGEPLSGSGTTPPPPAAAAAPVAVMTPLSDSLARMDSVPASLGGGGVLPTPAPPSASPPPVPLPVAPPPAGAEAAARPSSAPYAGPWTRAVAQSWVNVRGAASIDAAVVGVVTPNARVELGEVRGGWRRVRSAGVEGWADAKFFAVDSAGR